MTSIATQLTLTSTQSNVNAIKAKTDNLPAAPAATGDIPSAASIRSEIDANSTQLAAIVSATGTTNSTLAGTLTANVAQLDGSTTAATYLKLHALRAVPVTFSAGGTTTTAVLNLVDGAAASSTNDTYKDRVLIFSTPAALKDEACSITSYDGATKTATITAVTSAPDATAVAVLV
jgi:coenzyme F420-reducing hydrogenase beta subunit